MQIHELTLQNFRAFEALTLNLDPHLTVIAGVNASGKSAILEALSIAAGSWFLGFRDISTPSIDPSQVRWVSLKRRDEVTIESQFPTRIEVRGTVRHASLTWARQLNSEQGRTTRAEANELKKIAEQAQLGVSTGAEYDLPVLAYYGTGRLWSQLRETEKRVDGLESLVTGYDHALDPRSNHKLFTAWMWAREAARLQKLARSRPSRNSIDAALKDAYDPLLAAVGKAAGRCIEDGADLYFDFEFGELHVEFADGRVEPFDDLSDGQRNVIAMAADIAWRAVRLNPHLGEDAPQKARGIVLIDEVALHLHPAWQRRVLGDLRRTFPNLQFVVTTHSPLVLGSVESRHLRYITMTDGRREVQHVGGFEGVDPNTVLRDLMGVPPHDDDTRAQIERLGTLIDEGELDAATQILRAFEAKWGANHPMLVEWAWDIEAARDPGGDP